MSQGVTWYVGVDLIDVPEVTDKGRESPPGSPRNGETVDVRFLSLVQGSHTPNST